CAVVVEIASGPPALGGGRDGLAVVLGELYQVREIDGAVEVGVAGDGEPGQHAGGVGGLPFERAAAGAEDLAAFGVADGAGAWGLSRDRRRNAVAVPGAAGVA